MKTLLRRLMKILAYTGAAIVILLAVAVGLFRLFLPRLPEYQEEIKTWASNAIGVQVEFTGMDARWGLSGPELKFYGAELIRPGNDTRLVAAGEVSVGVSLVRLLRDRTLVVDLVTISDTSIEVRQVSDGSWRIQGTPTEELLLFRPNRTGDIGDFEVILQNIEMQLIRPGDERPAFFAVPRIVVARDDVRIAIDGSVRLPDDIGRSASVSATKFFDNPAASGWQVSLDVSDLVLPGLVRLAPDDRYSFGSGSGSLILSLAISDADVTSATASVDFDDVSLGNGPVFDISGRFDISNDPHGYLVAVDELRMSTPNGDWPRTSARLETSIDGDGNVVMIDARATYANLSDFDLFMPWLGDDQRDTLDRLRPDGIVRNMTATVSDVDTDAPLYSVAADFEAVGVAATGGNPGVRGFTGSLSADQTRGRIEIASEYMTLHLPRWLDEPVDVDLASGTVIWRTSDQRTTVLSDRIVVRNSVFDSESDIEVTIENGGSPVIDLHSTWSIDDLAAARRYIPRNVMKPKLYGWFQDAIVSGRMPRGSTRFQGPLDKFPFDAGEGRLLIEADVRDMIFRYVRQFPAAQVSEMHVVLDNTRLYTENNRSVNQGNTVVDARVEIADLRRPVLTIDSFSTGTLETIRDFSANSPIGAVFGGQLDRVTVSGDASFSLDLVVPITDWRSFTFTARVATNDGSLAIDGLQAPLTELTGAVTIERDLISSESLSARFLGEPVNIDLVNAPEELDSYRVIARASGVATADGLVAELGVPLQGLIDGRTDYEAQVLFPRANAEAPAPLAVRVRSDLEGLSASLPWPFAKSADAAQAFFGELTFRDGGARIESRGNVGERYAWRLGFEKVDDAWDIDRGMLMLGSTELEEPDVRGLHVRGRASELRLQEWLALSRREDNQVGIADRIRSIDISVDHLYVLGQHLRDHAVRVDRSARDWLVQLDGDQVAGSVFVPYDFSSDRALVLDMERLVLPGDDTREDGDNVDKSEIDPRALPPITVRAAEFAIGERYFGAVEADIQRTDGGLAAATILARDPTFEIVGNGSWLVDPEDERGYRTRITASLTSNNVEETMRRLNYQPGIVSDDMGMLFDLSWSGGPRVDFFDSLDGDVQVRFGTGQLEEVEPGAGRMIGLMSIVALPRRLSLDFRDFFEKGFGFDKIDGTFRIEKGVALTCDLKLEGPAANVGVIGQADLVSREYEQAAVVAPSVGNTLPIVGGLVAGPQAAVALLLFSQIFKDPLEEVGQVFYSMTGSFDDPQIESANAQAFATSGQLAGCVPVSE